MSMLWNAGFLLAGLLAGLLHFHLLRWNTRLFVSGRMARAFAFQGLRLVALAAVLLAAAWHGALPLLLAALGVMVAREVVVRRARAVP